jgi:hypothetical protein
MKLNKYQKAWIKKLQSGTTRKAKGQLFKSNRACCLGVALQTCGLDEKKFFIFETTLSGSETMSALNLRGEEGEFLYHKVSDKWKKIIGTEHGNLAGLNDNTKLSHVDIGNFINENREAVFYDS